MIWLLLGCFSYRLGDEDRTSELLSVSIISESGFAYNDEVLTCVPQITSIYENPPVNYAWYTESGGAGESLSNNETLGLSEFSFMPGDSIFCEVEVEEVFIGRSGSASYKEASAIIGNRDPVVDSIVLSNQAPEADSTISCSVSASDPDGGEITEEIEWTVDGTPFSQLVEITLTPNIAPVDGELRCTATITDEHGGSISASEEVIIQNTDPVIIQPAEIQPSSDVDTTSLLGCTVGGYDQNDAELDIEYLWKNGETELGADSILQLTPEIVDIDDTVTCTATVSDNNGGSISSADSVVVGNATPAFDGGIVINPNTGVYTGTELTCNATIVDPEDGELITFYYWEVDGSQVGTGSTYVVSAEDSNVGDAVHCFASASDSLGVPVLSSNSVTVENTVPVLSSVNISPSVVYNDDMVTCSATIIDPDEDLSTSLNYEWSTATQTLGYLPTLWLESVQVTPQDTLTCLVSVTDAWGEYVELEGAVNISNRAPEVPEITLSWTSGGVEPIETDDLICSAFAEDSDNETLSYSYSWTSDSGGSVSGDTVSASDISAGEVWTCTATAADSVASTQNAESIQIEAAVDWAECPQSQDIWDAPYQLIGENSYDEAGGSFTLLNIDGDEYPDVLIGATQSSDAAGRAYLIFGSTLQNSPSLNLSNADHIFFPENAGDEVGTAVSAGDVDGDGLDDILIGADSNGDGGSEAGKVYLVLSSTITYATSYDISLAGAEYTFIGEEAGDRVGRSISMIGDLDGDSRPEILIGALGSDDGGSDVGKLYVILSSSLDGVTTVIDLSNADYEFVGDANDQAGSVIASNGDFDGDGVDDILVGAYASTTGKAYLISGDSIIGGASSRSLSATNYTLWGVYSGDKAGAALSFVDDVNGDGLDDVLVGAYQNDDGGADAGISYLVLSATIANTVGLDIFLDNADYSFTGENQADRAGFSVSGMSDVDGDGFGDILIGATNNSAGRTAGSGKAYLVYSSSLSNAVSGNLDLSLADHVFLGEQSNGSQLGSSILGADIDGNGVDDVLISAPLSADNGQYSGSVLIFTACEENSCNFTTCDTNLDLGGGQSIDLVEISMGSDPLGRYLLNTSFEMMTTEVTQGMFYQLMGYESYANQATYDSTGSFGVGDNYPAYFVSWHMAADFANMVTAQHNFIYGTSLTECYSCSNSGVDTAVCSEVGDPYSCDGYRLPTEGEWEYAARSGTIEDFWSPAGGGSYSPGGCSPSVTIDDGSSAPPLLSDYAWWCGNSSNPYGSKEVGQKYSNDFGLHDMHGNVYEWTTDWLGCAYPEANVNPHCDNVSSARVIRGGRWSGAASLMTAAYQDSESSYGRSQNIGFRLVRGL